MQIEFCPAINQELYPFSLPKLPYDINWKTQNKSHILFSSETFDYHYGKHHKTYITKLNQGLENYIAQKKSFIPKTDIQSTKLEDIIKYSYHKDSKIFSNAAQAWNHSFFWNSVTPYTVEPSTQISKLIEINFNNIQTFKEEFLKVALNQFGSGWIWLIYNTKESALQIMSTSNADNPMVTIKDNILCYPLCVCDVWEHAYYIDYRNDRAKYINAFLDAINWNFVDSQLHYIQNQLNNKK